MSKTIKKVSAVSLSLTTAVWLSGAVLIMPVVASAATVEELQAQIASLLAQIQALQTQLTQTSGATATPSYNYTRDLTVGSKGDDVTALQNFLISQTGAKWPAGQSTTGYFGNVTKAALASYQASVGVSPAAGYFGPKSRAYVASLAAAPTTPTTPTTPGVTPPAGAGLAVALAADTPSARTIGSGTAFNPALKVNLTAGTTAVKVTGITLQKTGFLANTNLNGVDVVDSKGVRHGNVVTSINADNTVLLVMTNDPIVIGVGQTETVTVRFNLLAGSYTGTVSFGISASSAITADTTNVTGSFAVSGSTMNIVSGSSSLASTTLDVLTSTGSSTLNVDAASLQEMTKFRIREVSSNEAIKLYSLTLYQQGSAADGDVKDVTLVAQDGTVLATAQQVGKYVKFDLSASPYLIDKGLTKDFTIKAKLADGAARTVNFVVYNDYDIDLRGTATGVSVLPTATANTNDTSFPVGNGYNVQTIGSGSLTLNRAADSPSSAVTPGANNVVLAKFVVKPTGENMELRQVKFAITATSTALTGTVYVKVNNASVYSAAASGIANGGLGTAITLSTYPTMTAGSDSTITVETSIPSSATASDSYQVFNFDIIQTKRVVTNDLVDPSVSPVNGNNIAVQAAKLVVTTLGTPVANSVVAGFNNYEFATVQLNAQTGGEDVKVTKVRITYAGHNTPNSNIGNYQFFKDSDTSALTTTASTASLSSNASGATLDFNFTNPITVAKATPVTLHLKANVLSGASANATSTFNVASTTSAYTATGATTGNTVTPGDSGNTVSGNGQQMTVVAAGTLTMSLVSGSGASPSQDQVVNVGTSNQAYFAFRMTSQFETQKITSLKITATSTGAANLSTTTLANIKLYEGSATTPFASAAQFDGCSSAGCFVTFTASDNLLSAPVPVTGVTITAKADVAAGGSSVLGNNFKFLIVSSTDDVAVKGSVSGLTTATKTGTPTASGVTYVIPQAVVVTADSPTSPTTVGLNSGVIVGRFKVANNGTAPVSISSTTAFRFTNGGSATNSLTFALYASAMGGTTGDSSVTYIATSTASGASSTVDFDLTYVSAANRKIDGGSWRYLTIKVASNGAAQPGVPVNNNTFQFSVSSLGNLVFTVDEADLGYSGNPQSDNDLSDTITGLYIDGKPSLETVTAKT